MRTVILRMNRTWWAGCLWTTALLAGWVVAEEGRGEALRASLERTLDVDFRRDYPEDVWAILEIRTGLQCVYPDALARSFLFSERGQNLSAEALLGKVAAAGHLEMEWRGDRFFAWQRADDALLRALGENLKSPDRWTRCEAAWELGCLADPRIYPLLFQAAGDADRGVAKWALFALSRHQAVLPFLDGAGKEAAVQAAQEALAAASTTFFPGLNCHDLLGALNTATSTDVLLKELTEGRSYAQTMAVGGLGYCRNPRAVDALVKLAADAAERAQGGAARSDGTVLQPAPWWLRLPKALAQSGDPRCLRALIALAENPHLHPRARGQCLDALSRTRNADAADAVVKALAVTGTDAWDMFFCPDARDPRIADALATHLQDLDEKFRAMAISALAAARDGRAIAPLLESIEDEPEFAYVWLEELAGIREERAGEELRKLLQDGRGDEALFARGWGGVWMATRDPNAIARAFEVLRDAQRDLELRCAAARALVGALTERRQIAELAAYLKTEGEPIARAVAQRGQLARRLAEGVFSRDPAWVELLAGLAQDPNRATGNAALRWMGLIQNPRAQKALIGLLNHPDAQIRLGALRAFNNRNPVHQGDRTLADALVARRNEEIPALRHAAAIALGQLGDGRAVAPLIEAARAELGTEDALTVCYLLSLFDDPEATAALVDRLQDPENPNREQALYALTAALKPGLVVALLTMARDPKSPPELRAASALQLWRDGREERAAADLLCDLLNEPALERGVRVYVVGELRESAAPAVCEAFLKCIKNSDLPQDVREDVVALLAAANWKWEAKGRLLPLLDDTAVPASLRVRVAAMLLGGKPGRGQAATENARLRALQVLLERWPREDLSPGARRAALKALAHSGDRKALQVVYDAMVGADLAEKLSISVDLCIASLDENAIEPLLEVLKYGERKERRTASYALMAYLKAATVDAGMKQTIAAALDAYQKSKDLPVRPPPPNEEF